MEPITQQTPAQDERLLAAISYIYFLAPIILLLKRGNDFVQFHARQGFVLLLLSIAFWFLPFIAWLLNAIVFVGIVVGFIMALNGTRWRIPFVAGIAERFKL